MGGRLHSWHGFYRGRDIGQRRTAFVHAGKAQCACGLRNARVGGQCVGLVPGLVGQRSAQVVQGLGAAQQPQGAVAGSLASLHALRLGPVVSATGIGNHKIYAPPCGGDLLREPVAPRALLVGTRFGAAHDEDSIARADLVVHLCPQRFRVELRCIGCRLVDAGGVQPQGLQCAGRSGAGRPYSCFDSCLRFLHKRQGQI